MTRLIGAYSLDSSAVSTKLDCSQKARLLKFITKETKQSEFDDGRLWMSCPEQNFAAENRSCIGFEGFVCFGGSQPKGPVDLNRLANKITGSRLRPEGHYSLAHYSSDGSLSLIRDVSGGERLYYVCVDGLLFFSSSILPLLAHPGIEQSVDKEKVREVLINGLLLFGQGTLFEGINEVLPGHLLRIDKTIRRQEWHWPRLLEPLEGDFPNIAKNYRETLTKAVEMAVGPERPVAVTLSGGIDSSAITALIAEVVGASNIEAFTYEFDDPNHPPETAYAVEVCRRLGISQHRIFKITLGDYISAIPETVWRTEHFVNWSKAFTLPVARKIMSHGHSRFLTGFGIGSHMGYLEEFNRVLPLIPFPSQMLLYWKYSRTQSFSWLRHLEKIHPGLEIPPARLLLLILSALQSRGVIRNLPKYFHPSLREHLPTNDCCWHDRYRHMDLVEQLRLHCFEKLVSCVDPTRWQKALREIGIQKLSPAHFSMALPGAYMPIEPPPKLRSENRRLRPGKLLIRESLKGVLPESVLYRKKSWADAIVSPNWHSAGMLWMIDACKSPRVCSDANEISLFKSVRDFGPVAPQSTISSLEFWHSIFADLPPGTAPPTWDELLNVA